MLVKRSRIIIAALGTLLCFISAVYVSCVKPGSSPACNGVVCQNNGYCNKGVCVCPVGFEGANCATASVAKYIGTWDVTQTVVGSDSANEIGRQTNYQMFIQGTATPTTFFLDNFLGNASYNQLLCTLDSTTSNQFVLDSIRDQNMIYGIVYIMPNSKGIYTANTHAISANFIIRSLTPTHNWHIDTFSLAMTLHHF